MKKLLQKALNVDESELSQVLLLLQMGFLIGVFLATYEVAATTLFINNLDEDKELPLAVIATGVIGIIFTYIFSYLQNRIPYTRLSLYVLLIISIVVLAIRVSFGEISADTMKENKILIFIALVLMGPFDALVLLIFWGTLARMFSLKQQKRIVGGIDVGKGLATLFAFFTIPVISNFLPNTADLFFISGVSAFALCLTQIIITIKSPNLSFSGVKRTSAEKEAIRYGIRKMFKNPYIFSMIIFIVVATVASQFVDYSFINASGQQYPSEKDLQNFLAVFEGIAIIFAILVQTFVTDWVEEMYGLRVALIINPILLGVFTVVTALVGISFGFTPASSSFILFFLCIALSKLFTSSLKDAIDDAVFKFFYFPIESNIRLDVMASMDGIVRVGAGLIAGLMLLGIQYFHFSNLLLFTLALVPVILGWIFATNKMYDKYRETLRETLVNSKTKNLGQNISTEISLEKMLINESGSEMPERIIFALKLMERLEPSLFEKTLIRLTESRFPLVKQYVLSKIDNLKITGEGLVSPEGLIEMSNEEIRVLVKSRKTEDRIKIAKLYPHVVSTENEYLLIELLRDVDIKVRLHAINTIRKIKKQEAIPILIDLLGSPVFGNAAMDALVAFGDDILPILETAFHKSGQSDEIMFKIVQIYGKVGSERGMSFLWNKINYPDQEIVEQVLLAFSYNNIKVPDDKVTLINHIIEIEIGDAAWDIAALTEIKDVSYTAYLRKSLEDEIGYNFENIFTLLTLIYDYQSIQLVKENLESDIADSHVFAVELLDVFLSDELKPKLFPLLEDLKEEEMVNKLQEYFPREKFNSVDVLKTLISRDYTFTNRWTRACAIYALGCTPNLRGFEELTANLFHPDPILHETSAWAICTHEKSIYEDIKDRLPKNISKHIDLMLEQTLGHSKEIYQDLMPLRLQKTMFLKDIDFFQNIPSDIVSEIVELIEVKTFAKGDKIIEKGDSGDTPVYIVVKGRVDAFSEHKVVHYYTEREIFGETKVLDSDTYEYEIVAVEDTILFEIDKSLFFEELSKNHEFARAFIEVVGKRFEPELIEQK